MKGFFIEITNNLLDPKHREAMKESIWLFMWLLDKMTSITEEGIGRVLGGKPIVFKEIEAELGISKRTYVDWLNNLRKHRYINTIRTPAGLVITVNKARKTFGRSAIKSEGSAEKCKGSAGICVSNIRQYKDNNKNNVIIKSSKNENGRTVVEKRIIPIGDPPINTEVVKKLNTLKEKALEKSPLMEGIKL